jgi:hypothetical protein
MSLAMFAAPFDDNTESYNSDNNIIEKKKIAHNKTQKRFPKENFELNNNKVKSVLEKIHENTDQDDDDKDTFNPPPKAQSMGVQRTKNNENQESMMNMTSNNDLMFRTLGRAPQPNYEGTDNLDLNDYNNYGDNKSNEEYYKRVLPGYVANPQKNPENKPYYSNVNYKLPDSSTNEDILLQKLNYMITLLEDQQDEKTNNVTEEVVLYSFLGIFIIFIADSFVRAGKYVR